MAIGKCNQKWLHFFVCTDIYIENKILNTYLDMNKKLIRLTESDLHKIVRESVNGILSEMTQEERRRVYIGKIKNRLGGLDLQQLVVLYNFMTYKL